MDTMFKKPMCDATTQELQLELIRRTQHNSLDGERVAAWLLKNRNLWEAVLIDRIPVHGGSSLPGNTLIKLRDLPDNHWNTDTLYILTPTVAAAEELLKSNDDQDWGGMGHVVSKPQDVQSALGDGGATGSILTIWWD